MPLTGGGGEVAGTDMRSAITKMRLRVAKDPLLLALFVFFPMLWWWVPVGLSELPALVDWKTIHALAGLMLLSRALELSGALDRLGRLLLTRIRSLRGLAVTLVVFAAALSTVVTNDVALFITVPLTLGLGRVLGLPIARLVIFQALAVNAGSAASPIGNPQNLFLWSVSGAGFWEFTAVMLPIALVMLAAILAVVPLAFSSLPLVMPQKPSRDAMTLPLFWGALSAYPLFLLAVASGFAGIGAALLLVAFIALVRSVVKGIDWALLLVFVLMFVNLGLLGQIPSLAALAENTLQGDMSVLIAGVLVSQVMSNVPAAIFLAQFTEAWPALAWGVNVGGFGLAIGSLANLIAMRLSRVPGIWRDFHLWSLCLLAISTLAALSLFGRV